MDHTHLGLAALTPLQPSPSYSYIHTPSLPTTPSLLSRHASRSSLSHLGTSKSHPNIPSTSTSASSPAYPSDRSTPTNIKANTKSSSHLPPQRQIRKRRAIHVPRESVDDDWLTRTASTLTLSRLEEKGQAWLVARESSTSLSARDLEDEEEAVIGSPEMGRSVYASARSSFTRISRSRPGQKRGNAGMGVHGQSKSTSTLDESGRRGGGEREAELSGPDFVDERDLRELRGDAEWVEEDGEDEEVDEREMKRVIVGRVGGWVDWAVGWMDVRGEDPDEDEDEDEDKDERNEEGHEDRLDVNEVARRLQDRSSRDDASNDGEKLDLDSLPPPDEGGWVGDARWLFGLARNIAL